MVALGPLHDLFLIGSLKLLGLLLLHKHFEFERVAVLLHLVGLRVGLLHILCILLLLFTGRGCNYKREPVLGAHFDLLLGLSKHRNGFVYVNHFELVLDQEPGLGGQAVRVRPRGVHGQLGLGFVHVVVVCPIHLFSDSYNVVVGCITLSSLLRLETDLLSWSHHRRPSIAPD